MIAPMIAFDRGSATPAVWVAEANGRGARRLAAGSNPMLSPDGRYVAFQSLSSGTTQVQVLSIRPGVSVATGSTSASFQILAWSADSRYVAVAVTGTKASDSELDVIRVGAGSAAVGPVAQGFISGASFAPRGDRLVYAVSRSQRLGARVDLFTVDVNGNHTRRLTRNGRSLYPVWGRQGIAFDRERLRGTSKAPEYQVCLLRGRHIAQLTNLHVPALQDGLVPLQFDAGGGRLLAEYEGEDTSYAYTIQLKPLRVRQVTVAGRQVQGGAISRNGRELLVDQGAFENPANKGIVETVGFTGGRAHRLTRGADPSWNR